MGANISEKKKFQTKNENNFLENLKYISNISDFNFGEIELFTNNEPNKSYFSKTKLFQSSSNFKDFLYLNLYIKEDY